MRRPDPTPLPSFAPLRLSTGVRLSVIALVCVLAAAASPVRPASACATRHADSACVRPLSDAERAALEGAVAAIGRGDTEECRALARFIRAHAPESRILPYTIQTPYGMATGDAHVVEDPHGTGRVHVADSVLTRDGALPRPMSAKVRTLVHDFAHLALQLPQRNEYLATDAADDALGRCIP